jgi:hypothetical protein
VIQKLLLALLAVPLFLVTSCVEGEEEIWINLNGSGKVEARYEFPARALSKIGDPERLVEALTLIAAKEEGIEISDCSFVTEEGQTILTPDKAVFQLSGRFDNVLDLFEIASRNKEFFVEQTGMDPDQVASVIGLIDFRFEGLRPTFDREIRPAEIFPEFLAGMLGPSSFQYTIHLPAEVRQTNAHAVSEDGRTVTWVFQLKDHFDKPMTMSLDTTIPIPWWVFVLLLVLVVLVLGAVWWLFRRLCCRKSRPTLPSDQDEALAGS